MKFFENMRTYAWLELIIWLIIIAAVIFGIKYNQVRYQQSFKNYQLFLQDADSLIVGSPVRFLGVQIGSVTDVEIEKSEVYIKFIVTQKDLDLPLGAVATVESFGLGGSKALEIYPPDKNNPTDKIINGKDPVRLSRIMGLFDNIFRVLDAILTTCSHSADDLDLETRTKKLKENVVYPVENANKQLNNINKTVDNIKTIKDDFMKKFE